MLEILDVGGNMLSNIPEDLFNLSNLKMLIFGSNQITFVPPKVKDLIFDDQIIDLHYQKLGYTSGLALTGNPIENIPSEIVNQGFGAIKNYFESIEKKETTLFNSAKLMIVGRGRVGKTSLLQNLIEPKTEFISKEEDTTRGIDIRKWNFKTSEGQDFETRIWDFGGQQSYFTPHQFFLTNRSLYILVWDALQEEDDITFNHWLNQIKFFSNSSPVILVMNKSDISTKNIDEKGLKKAFPNILGFYQIACQGKKIGLNELRDKIKKELQNLPHVKNELPFTWKYIRNELESLSSTKDFISDNDYFTRCKNKGLNEKQGRFLSEYLHDLGTIIHYGNDPMLSNIIILNPDWLTKAIYSILDDKDIINNKGEFEFQDLRRIWKPLGYETYHFGQLVKLMEKFEFTFQLIESNKYLMPLLLSPNSPEIHWGGEAKKNIIYHIFFYAFWYTYEVHK